MPTYAEWTELIEQCTWTWMYLNGAYGKKVTSKTNGNSIFLPAAGCREEKTLYIVNSYGSYWSSSLLTKYSVHARNVYFVSSNMYWSDYLRHYGNSVRPVCPQNLPLRSATRSQRIQLAVLGDLCLRSSHKHTSILRALHIAHAAYTSGALHDILLYCSLLLGTRGVFVKHRSNQQNNLLITY